jgi:hypothetical protein
MEPVLVDHADTPGKYWATFASHAHTNDLLHDMFAPNMKESMTQLV